MRTMTDEQLKGYFKAVEEARDTKTLKSVLPLDLLPYYEEIMQKIIQKLKQSLDYYESYEDSEALLLKIDEIKWKLIFCEERLQAYTLQKTNQAAYFNTNVPRNLLFAKAKVKEKNSKEGKNNCFLKDLKKLDKTYYQQFYQLLFEISSGNDGIEQAPFLLQTKRKDQTLIDYCFLKRDVIYIIGARLLGSKPSLVDALWQEDYNFAKEALNSNNVYLKENFLKNNLEDIQEVWNFFIGKKEKKYQKNIN